MNQQPLKGIRVLDFSTLLPGPMCSLLLTEAGAEVIKVERPGRGDEMRSYAPKFGGDSVNFALLNRGKRSITLNLKNELDRDSALHLVMESDILIEQFRPGVMSRLGLGYEDISAHNPRIIYCSISGYGQTGPMTDVAAHDLNYLAESGMLSLCAGSNGAPVLPPALIADISGGAYPAMMNILLALRQRDSSGRGCYLDISMADNLFPLMYWALGNGWAAGQWPLLGGELVTGGTPRYQIYRTKDGRFLAAAPLEQKFWENFVGALNSPELLDDASDPLGVREKIASIISTATAAEWAQRFSGMDVCVAVVKTVQEATEHPHFIERGLFKSGLSHDGRQMPALPTPINVAFKRAGDQDSQLGYPKLGEANSDFFAATE